MMINIGFDPAFIDTIVKPHRKNGQLINSLPDFGHHHRKTDITDTAGGNGVNIAYVLKKLGLLDHLVIPSSDYFDQLLKKRSLQCSHRINAEVNRTVGLMTTKGEIQFNSVTARLSSIDWTKKIHQFWQQSKIGVSTNWGLNSTSPEWVSLQWLASCGLSFSEVTKFDDLISAALNHSHLKMPFIIEPGSIKRHHAKDILHQLLDHFSSQSYGQLFPTISYNEEEYQEFSNYQFPISIYHSTNKVKVRNPEGQNTFSVPPLSCTNPNFVGAGDALLAGYIYSWLNSSSLDTQQAVDIAQQYICNKFE